MSKFDTPPIEITGPEWSRSMGEPSWTVKVKGEAIGFFDDPWCNVTHGKTFERGGETLPHTFRVFIKDPSDPARSGQRYDLGTDDVFTTAMQILTIWMEES